jgi:hypothetical protein
VPWSYVQLLLLVVALLLLSFLLAVYGPSIWLLLPMVLLFVLLFWNLPKFVSLEQIPGDLTVAEGPVSGEDMQMKLDYPGWPEKSKGEGYRTGGRRFLSVVLLALALITVLILLHLLT